MDIIIEEIIESVLISVEDVTENISINIIEEITPITVIISDVLPTDALYYTKAQIDVLVVAQNRVFNEVPVGIMNGINATFTSEFDFIPETLSVFLNGMLQKIISDYNTYGNTIINLVSAPASIENLIINYTKQP